MIDERMYKANVKLVDDNNSLKRDVEILQDRINKALSKLEEISLYDEYITIHTDFINDAKQILKGESNE